MKRFFAAFLVILCMLLSSLTACSSSEGLLEEYKQMLESISDDNGEAVFDTFADKVYVVIPERSSAELGEKARELLESIIDKTGVPAIFKYDNEKLYTTERDVIMLLGNTKYLASEENVRQLKHNDYVCKWDNGTLILGGRHDEATVEAVDRFIAQVLHGASPKSLMPENAGFEYITEYEVPNVSLNGYDLYDYTIVYSEKNTFGEREYAIFLREVIAARSGYFLDIIPDSELDRTVGKTIFIEGNAKKRGCSIAIDENNVFVKASDSYAFSVVCDKFIGMIFDDAKDGKACAQISALDLNASSVDIKICRAFSITDRVDSIEFISAWSEKVQTSDGDIIIFDKIDPNFLNDLKREKGSYLLTTELDGQGNLYPVLYRDGIFDSVRVELRNKVLYVDAKVSSELETRRVICPTLEYDGDATKLLSKDDEYCVLVTNEVSSNRGNNSGDENSWSFQNTRYCHTVFFSEEIVMDESKIELDAATLGNFANAVLSFSCKIECCHGFKELKNSLER